MKEFGLEHSELRYRRLFESAHDGILIIDNATKKIIDANPYILDLLEYQYNELCGKELYEIGLLKDRELNESCFDQLQLNGYIRYEDLPLQTKSGLCKEVEFVSNLYDENGKKVIQCNIRDITQRKQAEQISQAELKNRALQLERLVTERTSKLKQINQQLETFVYSIAHDLRAPLRSIQGFSSLLLDEIKSNPNKTSQHYAERIDKSAIFMDKLLADLLHFSQTVQEHVRLAPTELETIISSVIERLNENINNAKIETASLELKVLAHKQTLEQIVFNLVSNALKFAKKNTPPRIHIYADETDQKVRLWIKDNGIGIAPDHQEQIFRLFTRLHSDEYPGTGVGLAIVQQGIERLGGRVGVESVPGQGSQFWLELQKADSNE